MASTNAFLTLVSTIQTNSIGSTIATGFIPYISTAGRQAYSNTLSTLTVSTLTTTNVNTSTMVTSTISGAMREPTVKLITAVGSGTYIPAAAGVVRIKVRMCGGGGGGSGLSSANGGNGYDTTFGGWTAKAGLGGNGPGNNSGQGGQGGANNSTPGTGVQIISIRGGQGMYSNNQTWCNGGTGGSNPLGGGGQGGNTSYTTGMAGLPNTGGGGGGCSGSSSSGSGSGGGAGNYVEFYVTAPSYGGTSYAVGDGGTAGSSTNTGGVGGSGIIIIEEFYI